MKDNAFTISSDGNSIAISVTNRPPLFVKLVLLLLNFVLVFAIVYLTISKLPIVAFLALAFTVYFVRFSLWNCLGKEQLTISTKAINYQYDYGFFKSQSYTNKIGNTLEIMSMQGHVWRKSQQLSLIFTSLNENDIAVEVYRMVLSINDQHAKVITREINHIFVDKLCEAYELPPIYMN